MCCWPGGAPARIWPPKWAQGTLAARVPLTSLRQRLLGQALTTYSDAQWDAAFPSLPSPTAVAAGVPLRGANPLRPTDADLRASGQGPALAIFNQAHRTRLQSQLRAAWLRTRGAFGVMARPPAAARC